MEEKRQSDLLSQLLPDALEEALGLGDATGQESLLAQRLRAVAGQAGGPFETAVQEFLNGEGELHATTQAAVTRSSGFSEANLAALLKEKFGLAPVLANLIASLLIKLFPGTKKAARKPRRKPKTTTRPKSEAKTGSKKPKKKAVEKPKKPAAKKTTAKKPAAKKPAAKKKTRAQD